MTRMITRRRAIALGLAAVAMPTFAGKGFAALPYREVHYQSDGLNIQAYFYRPMGGGPFPLIVYNHGSREGEERQSVPWVKIAELFVNAGYAVLVPERRGYGKSDGETWSDAVGSSTGERFINRCNEEAGDVVAAAVFGTKFPVVDPNRIGVVGYSLGGIMTMLAIARSTVFRAAVDQAGGVLSWRHISGLQSVLEDAARSAKCPVFLTDAENDAAPEDIPDLADVMNKANLPHEMKMYPPYFPPPEIPNPNHIAPGHGLFGPPGIPLWGNDAIAYLDAHLKN